LGENRGFQIFSFSKELFLGWGAIAKEGWHYGYCERGYLFMGTRGGGDVFIIVEIQRWPVI